MISKSSNMTMVTRQFSKGFKYVPNHLPVKAEDADHLAQFLRDCRKVTVITGAGVSTESGIPDYRSEGVGLYATSPNRPIQYKDFVDSDKIRKRYWGRNFVGWPYFSNVRPNATHSCLSQWERDTDKVVAIVTQNVDNLHVKAGSRNVVELHGTAWRVKCLSCGCVTTRHEFQRQLQQLNPMIEAASTTIRPDGDIELPQEQIQNFNVPNCLRCDGIMKPDIVFFGDNVAKSIVDSVYDLVHSSDGILVVGSSLQVYSAYRFILAAAEQKKPIGIVNIGPTRADHLASFIINARSGELLPQINL